MKYLHIYILVLLAALSCSSDNDDEGARPNPNPDAGFEVLISNPYPCVDEEIFLSYFIQGESSAKWTVGEEASTLKKQIKATFDAVGKYPIKLEVTNDKGEVKETIIEINVLGEKLEVELEKLAKSDKFWVCAHRANTLKGLTDGSNMAPENSIKAIEMAVEQGAHMVEIDIRVTSDKEFVIMHDKSVTRTTNGSGNVSSLSLADIKKLSLKDNAGKVTEHKIPTLKEALEAGRGKVFYNIDLGGMLSEGWTKDDTKRLVSLVKENHMIYRVLFYIGSNQTVGNDINAAFKESLLFPWISNMSNLSDWKIAKAIQIDAEADQALIDSALGRNVPSFSNHLTADDDALLNNKDYSKLDNLVNKNIKIIQTDYVELVDKYIN